MTMLPARADAAIRTRVQRIHATADAFRLSATTTLRAHAQSDFDATELRLYRPWYPVADIRAADRVLLSVNEFRPHRRSDLIEIATISARLEKQVLRTDGALAIVTSYQPWGRITYSLSLWADAAALEEFTASPEHVTVMNTYRSRGYLRHIHWWGRHRSIGASMAEARHRLDAGQGRRVGEPHDRWARRDQRRLAVSDSAR
ncbi:hypothetical protein AB0L57_14300 [Nocardia sp. NPDC052254]|uniref:hypothetical protein n=1 Tax=Nocardia sp. NPDC052254 TaxID=3155681 RepID=UPI00342168B0